MVSYGRTLAYLCVLALVSCRASPDHLLLAAKQGDVEQITRLLDRGISIVATNSEHQTALHIASRWGRDAAVKLLLDRGAPLEAADSEGRTPLHLAAKENQASTAALLLERGARDRKSVV